jgi:branched-chain amino acid transport system ATP-binding protein
LKGDGLPILLVEQNLRMALDLGDRHYVMSKGEICFVGATSELEHNEPILKKHLSL